MNSSDNTLYWYNGSAWVAAKDAGATSVFYQTIRDDGVARTQRNNINFVSTAGNTMTATDDLASDETEITVDTVFANPTATTTFGLAAVNGSAVTSARSDHTHGTPTHDNAAHSAVTLNSLAVPTAAINMNGQYIQNLLSPVGASDAATKSYVDNASAGLSWKEAVRAATTANGTLASAFANGQAIDGVTLATNDRILLKNQTTQTGNGIYTVNSAGAPTRATDADNVGDLEQATVFVMEGTTLADTAWVCTTNGAITPGSTATAWAQFASSGGSVPTTRAINTTGALTGGGDLSADRTISVLAGGITPAMLQSTDFGDFTVAAGVATIDAGV